MVQYSVKKTQLFKLIFSKLKDNTYHIKVIFIKLLVYMYTNLQLNSTNIYISHKDLRHCILDAFHKIT